MLTAEQKAIVKADILADPSLSAQPNNSDGAFAIAAAYNTVASPQWVIWRSQVLQDEIMQNGFDWTRVDNLGVGSARVWEWMFSNSERSFNPSRPNVRAGIEAVWKGTSADLAVRAAVYVHCKRDATRIEKLLSTGAGSTATPATMGFEGPVSYADIETARNS